MARRRQLPPLAPPPNIHAGSGVDERTQALMDMMEELGHPIVPVSKKRTAAQQAELYARGRTTKGDIVTEKSGKPGDESKHQTGDAIDFAFIKNGQPSFDESHPWDLLGLAAKTVGFEWGGDWTTLVDRPHVQMPSRAKFEKGSQVAAQTDPSSIKIEHAPVAPPVPRQSSPLGVGTAEAGARDPRRDVPPAPRVATRNLADQVIDGTRGRHEDIELENEPTLDGEGRPGVGANQAGNIELTAPVFAPTPSPDTTPRSAELPMPPQNATPTAPAASTAPAAPAQAQFPTIIVNVPGDLVGATQPGMIRVTLPPGTPPEQMQGEAMRLAKAQVDRSRLGVTGGPGQFAGAELPQGTPEMHETMAQAIAAFPQLAALLVEAKFPSAKNLTGMLRSMAIPAGAQATSNVLQGKDAGEDVVNEAAMGGVVGLPHALGRLAKDAAEPIMRHNLFSQTPVEQITPHMEDVLPRKALNVRATPTKAGVKDLTKRVGAARDTAREASLMTAPFMGRGPSAEALEAARGARGELVDLRTIRNMTEAVRKHDAVRGSGSSISTLIPGSGMVTGAAKAVGAPPRLAQVASPVIAIAKGNPRRRMAIARHLDRPGNLANSDDLGRYASQIARLLAALEDALEPAVSHGPPSTPIRHPNDVPRRRAPQ